VAGAKFVASRTKGNRRLKLLLDTNTVSKLIAGRQPNFRINAEKSRLKGDQHCTSVIVVFELEYGALHGPHPALTRQRNALAIAMFETIYSFEKDDAYFAADIREALASVGQPSREYDVLVAAQALRNDCVMVTNNTKHFSCIKGLKLTDWS
jgi:tRNA(fMet)-specific endonuclease VapC